MPVLLSRLDKVKNIEVVVEGRFRRVEFRLGLFSLGYFAIAADNNQQTRDRETF